MNVDSLDSLERLGVDTVAFIYFIEDHPKFAHGLKPLFDKLDTDELEIITSTITLTELLVKPLQKRQDQIAEQYRDLLLHSRGLTCQPATTAICSEAAALRADYQFRTPDALQLATALVAEADAFLTNDEGLQKCEEIDIILCSSLPN